MSLINSEDLLRYFESGALLFQPDVRKIIESMPTIEAEPVRHGRWIEQDSFHYELHFKCSVCGNSENMPTRMYKPIWEYCPNCGAKMDGERIDDAKK